MKLIRLVTNNFKKLSDFAADFADGLNVLVGENARGKSTVLQAIEAALFGVTVVPGKKEMIPTWGQTNFSLELHFEVDGKVYELTRNKSTAKLVRVEGGEHGDALVANGNTPVTKFIEELLGLAAKDFNLFVNSRQGETAGVLTFGATALNQKVEEFAGISVIDSVAKRAQELATTGKAAADVLLVPADELTAAADTALNAYAATCTAQEAANEAKLAVQTLPEAPQETTVSSEELTRSRRDADRRKSALAAALAALDAAETAVQDAEGALADAVPPVDTEELEADRKLHVAELKNLKSILVSKQAGLNTLRLASRKFEQVSEALGRAEPISQEEVQAAEDQLAAAESTRGAFAADLAVAEVALSNLVNLSQGALCPTCGTQLTEHDPEKLAAEIEQVKDSVSDLKKELSAASQGATASRSTLAAKSNDMATLLRLTMDVQQAELHRPLPDQVVNLEREVDEMQERIDDFTKAVAEIDAKVDSAERINNAHRAASRRLLKAQADRADTRRDAEAAHADLIEGPTDAEIDAAIQTESQYREARTDWLLKKQAADNALASAITTRDQAEREYASALGYQEKLTARNQEAKQRLEQVDQATRLARFLRDRRQSYLKEVWDGVLAVASRHIKMATKGLITRVAYEAGEFQFEEDGVMAPVTSASGAQKAFIGTSVRIGLARALYGSSSLLIFDEPTESMSENHAAGLASSLVGAACQTLLITHREQDQSLAANIITVGE